MFVEVQLNTRTLLKKKYVRVLDRVWGFFFLVNLTEAGECSRGETGLHTTSGQSIRRTQHVMQLLYILSISAFFIRPLGPDVAVGQLGCSFPLQIVHEPGSCPVGSRLKCVEGEDYVIIGDRHVRPDAINQ